MNTPCPNTPYRAPIDISFKHCDPAGIVFYPRYVEMLNDVVEQWFKNSLACDFATLHGPRGMAVPVARLEIDFKSPGRLGETMVGELRVRSIGHSSMSLAIDLRLADEVATPGALKLSASLIIVFVDLVSTKPVGIPRDLRHAAGRYVLDAAAGGGLEVSPLAAPS